MITGLIISYNEEDNIARAINSLKKLTSEIILIDAQSTDNTAQIAMGLGAQVFIKPWEGYGATKNYGISKASKDWIFSLDADEEISPALIENIKRMQLVNERAYHFRIVMDYLGKKLRFTEYAPHWKPRLYHKDFYYWDDRKVHEKLVARNRNLVEKIKGDILHYSFRSKEHHHEKIDRYARLSAEELLKNQKSPSWFKRSFGPAYRFLRSYILKLGVLEGREGMYISKMGAELIRKRHAYFDQLAHK